MSRTYYPSLGYTTQLSSPKRAQTQANNQGRSRASSPRGNRTRYTKPKYEEDDNDASQEEEEVKVSRKPAKRGRRAVNDGKVYQKRTLDPNFKPTIIKNYKVLPQSYLNSIMDNKHRRSSTWDPNEDDTKTDYEAYEDRDISDADDNNYDDDDDNNNNDYYNDDNDDNDNDNNEYNYTNYNKYTRRPIFAQGPRLSPRSSLARQRYFNF